MTKLFTATCRMAGWLAIATFALLAVAPVAQAQPSSLTAFYDPATGNIKLQNTTSSVLEIGSFNLLTLGNGSVGPATSNNQGYLNGATVTFEPAGQGFGFPRDPSFFVINDVASAEASSNGLYSQVAATLFPNPSLPRSLFQLTAYSGWSVENPIGPSGSFWDLGNIAQLGMTPANINSWFVTNELQFGQFAYATRSGATLNAAVGNVVSLAAVPEPSTLALAGAGVAGLGYWRLRRRQG